MNQPNSNNYTYSKLKISYEKDIMTLQRLKKWTKSVLNRIEVNASQIQNYKNGYACQNESFKKNNENSQGQKLKRFSKVIPKMVSEIINSQLEENQTSYITEKPTKIMEELYERKYQRNYYDVTLYGEDLNKFATIYERIDEINRCTGVKSPEMVLPIEDKSSKKLKLKVRVKDFNDYTLLLNTWPSDSFKSGVSTRSMLPKLKIIILNVERKLKINKSNIEIKELCNKHGLYNIKRIYNHSNNPCNKLVAECEQISDFIRVLKHGVTFGKDVKKYLVLPYISNYKVCSKCGSLNHQEKDCFSEQRCLKCAKSGHRIQDCKSLLNECLNCSGPHKCFSDYCEKFSRKKVHINRFVLKILLGENFISNSTDILQTKENHKKQQQKILPNNLESSLNDKVQSVLLCKLNTDQTKIETLEQTINSQSICMREIKSDLRSIYEAIPDIQPIREAIKDLQSDITAIKQTLDLKEDIQQMRKTLNQLTKDSRSQLDDLLRGYNTDD